MLEYDEYVGRTGATGWAWTPSAARTSRTSDAAALSRNVMVCSVANVGLQSSLTHAGACAHQVSPSSPSTRSAAGGPHSEAARRRRRLSRRRGPHAGDNRQDRHCTGMNRFAPLPLLLLMFLKALTVLAPY